jgi:hypothetical protein
MAITHNLYTLSNISATRLTPQGTGSGMDITVQNINDSAYVYIGGPDVSSSNFGYRLSPNTAISWELSGKDNNLFAISDINESQLAVIKTALEVGN